MVIDFMAERAKRQGSADVQTCARYASAAMARAQLAGMMLKEGRSKAEAEEAFAHIVPDMDALREAFNRCPVAVQHAAFQEAYALAKRGRVFFDRGGPQGAA